MTTRIVAESIRAAIEEDKSLRIAGAGTWLEAGGPVDADDMLSIASNCGVVEYVPGDLTLTARAGTTLGEIAEITARSGQWLPLEPFGALTSTLGAVVATGSSGPLAHAHGGPRDQVLGIEAVTGNGDIVRGGGRVTKNVAGFDLTRLFIGSWGTLGAITEITVRLRARAVMEATFALALPEDIQLLAERVRAVRLAPLEAISMELVDRTLAASLRVGDGPTLLVRLSGNVERLATQQTTLGRVGKPVEIGSDVWRSLAEIEPADAWTWRMSNLPSRIGDTWAHAERIARTADRCWIHATPSRGVVRCIALARTGSGGDGRTGAALLGAAIADPSFPGTLILEKVPREIWSAIERSAAAGRISTRVRKAFDPHALLNPGILGPRE